MRSGEANLRYSSSELRFVINHPYRSAFHSLVAWGDISLRLFSDLGKVGIFKVFFIFLSISTLDFPPVTWRQFLRLNLDRVCESFLEL